MRSAPLPENEAARLATLYSYELLDSSPEQQFDDITSLAAAICATPMALLSLVDRDRQWFKSVMGMGSIRETPRDVAFCAHTILNEAGLEVPDVSQDSRFRDNPMVLGSPHVGFYAAIPLRTSTGFSLGALCVLDHQPRHLTTEQRQSLKSLASLAAQLIEARKVELTQQRLLEMADEHPALIAYVGHDERYRFFNRQYCASFPANEVKLGMSIQELIGDEAYRRAGPHVLACLSGSRESFENELLVGGVPRTARITFSPRWSGDGTRVEGFHVFVVDVTEHKNLENALFQEKELAQVTLKSIGDGVITTDVTGMITYLNPIAETMTGWRNDEALGLPFAMVFNVVDGNTRAAVANPLEKALRENQRSEPGAETLLIRRDGYETFIEDSAAPIHDRAGNVNGGVLVFHDVREARFIAMKMSQQAQHDFLTGLPNRLLLNDRLAQAIMLAERHRSSLAVLFLDLDRFKQVNDSLGHSVGDQLLQEVGRRLLKCVRGTDTVCRQGGDEFVILLSEIDHPRAAQQVAEKLLATIAQPYLINAHELHVTLSIGISTYPDDGRDAEAIIKNADAAMYHAKELGRNNYQVFTQPLNDRAVARFTLETNLRRAIQRNEFVLHYQPKINLSSGSIIGSEALIRWRSPDGQLIPPAQFIPIAEESGLIIQVGEWVMREACRQNREWQQQGFPAMPVAVNVSPLQFRRKGFLDLVKRSLEETGLDPHHLELELTESVVMENIQLTTDILTALTSIGVRLSIDDFGTGYSSLSYLRRFPIDTLKIDRSFIDDIVTNPDDAAITSAIISMAKSLKQRVIAEGVETAAQLAFLRARACDEMQGYYFSQPVSAEEFVQKFFRGNLLKTMPLEWLGHFGNITPSQP